MSRLLIVSMVFSLGAIAGDDPFIMYRCRFERQLFHKEFDLQFRSDSSAERAEIECELAGTKLIFDKQAKDSVDVTVITAPAIIAKATPAEYHFMAPLVTREFHFVTGVAPVTLQSTVFSLRCNKR